MNMMTFEEWSMLDPMRYYDTHGKVLSATLQQKYDDMVNNTDDQFIASKKWDGEWGMFIKWDGHVLIRSRTFSKVTNAYGDKTAHLPHLVAEMQYWPEHTVVLGEICWPVDGMVSTDVGTILRCLPKKAIERQAENKLYVKVFDILACNEIDYMKMPYQYRTQMAINFFNRMPSHYFQMTEFCPADKTPAEFADEIIRNGGEGAVIQRKDCIYEPGKRTTWHTLKLKQTLPEAEYKVLGTIEPSKAYQGKCPDSWPYFVDGMAVTKPYFYGWKMGVTFDYNGVRCDASSGLTDADREWLATDEAQQMIQRGSLYVTIRGMMVASLGAIRHPVIVKLREMDDTMIKGD